jgi:hypothetical protein
MGDNQQGLTVIPRMCLRKIKSKAVPIVEFICIYDQCTEDVQASCNLVTFHALLQILAHLTPEVTLMCHVCS